MIAKLKSLGVVAQAIEQPLDLSVPENKMMLAFYLAIPEVENDRRGLNTKMGIQRAKERDRVIGKAPIGYVNYCMPDGMKSILPKQPEASIIEYVFERLVTTKCKIKDAYLDAANAGLKCCISNFWKLLQNPIYAGKLKIYDQNQSVSYLIPALHKGIISVETFEKVQMMLFNKNKSKRDLIKTNSKFPLRGFITCPKCGKFLTDSTSKGRVTPHSYYHCKHPCGFRIGIGKVQEKFFKQLSLLVPQKNILICM